MTPSLALRGVVRRWVSRLHRWTGLAIMACLLVASVTGIWLVFRVELDRLVNPGLRVVVPQSRRVALQSVVEEIGRRFPNTTIHTLVLQTRDDDSISAYLDAKSGERLDVDRVFFNPYSGVYLGGSNTRELVFARSNVDPLIDRLHYSLWMKTTGLWLMGGVAFTWLATSLVGLLLAWPRRALRIVRWLPVLSTRLDRGSYQTSYRLHRATGVWFLPIIVVLAFTSFYQNLPQFVRPVVNALSPLASRPPGTRVVPGGVVSTPDRALDSLVARFPDAHATSIGFDRRNGRYSILFRLNGDPSANGEQWAFVDLARGEIIGTKLTATERWGDAFLSWIFPLHTGTAFGLPGRVVIALAGVGLLGLMATGIHLWWRKWQMRRKANFVRRLAATAAVAAILATVSHAQGAYPRTFTDGNGHTVTLAAKPVRIASTVLGIDENLMDLVDPSRIAALTELSKKMPDVSNVADRVPAAKAIVRGPQAVIDAKPDLVVTATYTTSIADALLARKLPVYQFSEWNSVEALLGNFEMLGRLVGEEEKAASVLKADRALLAAAAEKKWPTPIRAVYYSEGLLFAANTVPSQVLTLAGLADAASEFGLSGYVKSSPALLRNLNPDVVLFGEDNDEEQRKTAALFKSPEFQSIAAIKAGRLYAIPGKHITTTSHVIVQAVADVQRLVGGG